MRYDNNIKNIIFVICYFLLICYHILQKYCFYKNIVFVLLLFKYKNGLLYSFSSISEIQLD